VGIVDVNYAFIYSSLLLGYHFFMGKTAKSLAEIFKLKKDTTKYVNHEFQIYGHWLALQLDAPKNQISLFIKLAKDEDRILLEKALEFTKSVYNPKSKVKLFMWKLKKLRQEKNKKTI